MLPPVTYLATTERDSAPCALNKDDSWLSLSWLQMQLLKDVVKEWNMQLEQHADSLSLGGPVVDKATFITSARKN